MKAQVATTVSPESGMLLKPSGQGPPERGCLRILLTGLLTTAVDGNGCNWTPATSATPTSRPVRQQRTGLDGRDLATDQKVGGLLGLRRPSVTSRRPGISCMRKRRGCPAAHDRRCLVYQLVVLEGRYHEQGEVHAARDVALENGVTYVPAPHG